MEPTTNPNVAWACATALIAVILVGLFVLCWHGSLSGAAVLPVVASIASAAVAIFGVGHGVNAGARAALKAPPSK